MNKLVRDQRIQMKFKRQKKSASRDQGMLQGTLHTILSTLHIPRHGVSCIPWGINFEGLVAAIGGSSVSNRIYYILP